MHSLPIFVRLNGRSVILVGTGDTADAKRRLLERAGATIVDETGDAVLAIVADGDEAAAARLRARGILVNVTDRPDLCDFTLPAIVDRSPVIVAIGTGGASAGLAKALRQRFEAIIPANVGTLAERLFARRDDIRRSWPDAGDRRRAIDAALDTGGSLDSLNGSHDVDAWLTSSTRADSSRIETIELHSDDPDDLTLRAARLLGQADHVFHPLDMSAAILGRARADAVRHAEPLPVACPPGLVVILKRAAQA